jgi:transcriptional regulator with XRE-family HTH domain
MTEPAFALLDKPTDTNLPTGVGNRQESTVNPFGPPWSTDRVRARILDFRVAAGMSQQDLAERLGVTREYVSMIENGRRAVTRYPLLAAFARGLGVDVTALTDTQVGHGHPYPAVQPVTLVRLMAGDLYATVEHHGDEVEQRESAHAESERAQRDLIRVLVFTVGLTRVEIVGFPAAKANGLDRLAVVVDEFVRGTS